MLPEFKDVRIYTAPSHPPTGWTSPARVDYTTEIVPVAPDNVCAVFAGKHALHTDAHHEPGGAHPSSTYDRATGPEYETWKRVDGNTVVTYHGRIDLCRVELNSGTKLLNVIGTREEIREYLRPSACPPAAATGITLDVTTGMYRVRGDCGGDVVLGTDDAAIVLDPARLSGYEYAGGTEPARRAEWLISKVPGGNTRQYRFRISQTAAPTFTMQQWVPGSEPRAPGAWSDVVGTVNTLQAETRLRVKP